MANNEPNRALNLVLDQGGSSSRAMVFDERGDLLATARRSVATERRGEGRVEQSPEAVVDSLREAAAEAVLQLDHDSRGQLGAAGIVCQRSSLLGWDRHSGKPLTPILSWQDTRAADWLARQRLDTDRIRRLTGLYPNAHFGASKMHWCLQHLPEPGPAETTALAPLASYLIYALAENRPFLVDPANAARTLLMNLQQRDWEPELLHRFGIARELLPRIVPSLHDFGVISVAGLRLPLKLLNGDQSAAAFAEGEPSAARAYVNLGTGGFVYRILQRPQLQGRLLCSLLVDDGRRSLYALEGTVNGAAAALQWFGEHSGVDAGQPEIPSQAFFAEQSQLPLFINGVGGLGSPDWRADCPVRFQGDGDDRHKLWAVVESIAFLLQRNLDRLYADGDRPQRLIASGGLSGSDVLCQLLADLSGTVVERVVQREASARGGAWLLAADKSRWQTAPGQLFRPGPAGQTGKRYRRWTGLLEQELAG